MGLRLHVAEKYDVKWDTAGYFNYKTEFFIQLLDVLGIQYHGEPYESVMEIQKDEWKKGIEKLQKYDNLDDDTKAHIANISEELGYTVPEIANIMRTYEKNADQDNDFLYFIQI